MNTTDSHETGGTVIHLSFKFIALVSVVLLLAAYVIFRFLTAGGSY
jgi:hypothetical protein